MNDTFLLPMARNLITGQTVKSQDLTGGRFLPSQRSMAQEVAEQIAERHTARTGQPWVAVVETYTPRAKISG